MSHLTPGPDHRAETADQLLIVEPANAGVATQIANPARAVARTVVAVLVWVILALPTANFLLAEVADYLATQGDLAVPGWVWVALNATIAGCAFVAGLITRILAVPGVNRWIIRHVPALAPIKPIQ